MVQLMRPGQFLRGDVATTASRARRLFLAGVTLVLGMAFFARTRRCLVVRGVMSAGARRTRVMRRFHRMFR